MTEESLHPLERKLLSSIGESVSTAEAIKLSGMQEIEVLRAAQWLQNKKLAHITEQKQEIILLGKNGKEYKEKGLPEIRFLKAITGKTEISKIQTKTNLSREELGVCLGTLKKKVAIEVTKEKELVINITEQGERIIKEGTLEQKFLEKNFPIKQTDLSPEDKFAFDSLKQRRDILNLETKKLRTISLTSAGLKLKSGLKDEIFIEKLTSEIIRNKTWQKKLIRPYDVEINVPKIFAGREHAYADFIYQARQKLALMGFQEMTGPTVELEFYNFDALYQPQNHPARTWTSTYNVKGKGTLPEQKLVAAVKRNHETGGKTGSKGWGGTWNPEIAARLVARAHDTAISPRYLAKGVESPGKYFSLVRCYRPDVIDATHGVEFNQMGGFVIGKDLNFRHLLGLLIEFAKEMTGAKEFKFFPDYFPFTEPSVQISAKTEFGWMELCGAGVFRPEMTEALGVKEPVIAWGFGIDRLAMLKLGVKDIRDLFSKDLNKLRNQKKVLL